MSVRGVAALVLAAATAAGCSSTTAMTPTGEQGEPVPAGSAAGPENALSTLYSLAVADLGPAAGYGPQQFGPRWADTDGNGCDTLDDVLRRDLIGVEVRDDGCVVLSGTLVDPYTGTSVHYGRGAGGGVEVDPAVSLLDAWRTGMRARPAAVRLAFANDPMNLYAVSRTAWADRDGADAASWLPPAEDFRCTYVATQVGVKRKYGLWVTRDERAAMAGVLENCPNLRVPAGGNPTRASVPGPSARPGATPTASADPTPGKPTPHGPGRHGPSDPPGGSPPPPTSAPVTTSPGTTSPTPDPAPTQDPPDPRFNNCQQARAHGYGPYYYGRDVEYFWYPDTDLDGVVCE